MSRKRCHWVRFGMFALVLGVAWSLSCGLDRSSAQKKDPPRPVGETIRGTLTAKGGTWVEVRPEGEKTSRRYILAPAGFTLGAKAVAFLEGIVVGSEVRVTYKANRQITELMVLGAPGASGLVTGTVTGVSTSGTWYLEVRDDQGRTDRYWPAYRVGPGHGPVGGFDKEMSRAFTQRNVADRVEIRRSTDDHIRVVTMRLLALSDRPTKMPGGEGGTVVGQVAEKGKDDKGVAWIVVTGDDGTKERYLPQRIIGTADEVDKDVLRAIGAIPVGQRVQARWFRDGERRLYSLKKAPNAPAAGAKPAAPRGGG